MFGWWDNTPLKSAIEYYELDFEFGYEADVLSTLYTVGTVRSWGHDEFYVSGTKSNLATRGFFLVQNSQTNVAAS